MTNEHASSCTVTWVRSNLKGSVEVELFPKTLIYGPNATGKTAITQSVELALTGSVSDLIGRVETKRALDLLTLGPAGAALFAEVGLSDGKIARYTAEPNGKGGAKTPVHEHPPYLDTEKVLPLRLVRDALLGAPATTRKFFIGKTTTAATREDILERLPEDYRKQYLDVVARMASHENCREELVAVIDFAAKQGRDGVAAAKEKTIAATEIGRDLPPPPTESEIERLRKEVSEAERLVKQIIERQTAQKLRQEQIVRARDLLKTRDTIVGEIQNQQRALIEAQAGVRIIEQQLSKMPQPRTLTEAQVAFRKILHHLVESNASQCALCGSEVQPRTFGQILEQVVEKDQADAAAGAEYRRGQEALTSWNLIVSDLQNAIAKNTGKLREIDQVVKIIETPEPAALEDTLSEEEKRLRKARAEMETAVQAKTAWSTAQKAVAYAKTETTEANQWKSFAEACGEVARMLLVAGRQEFIQKVQKYLPSGDRFDLKLEDGSREICQVGLVRRNGFCSALSGAEWARVVAALGAACAPETGPWIIIPEERAFDPDTLTKVLEAFSRVEGQVLLASPVMPTSIPKPWRLVSTEAMKHG